MSSSWRNHLISFVAWYSANSTWLFVDCRSASFCWSWLECCRSCWRQARSSRRRDSKCVWYWRVAWSWSESSFIKLVAFLCQGSCWAGFPDSLGVSQTRSIQACESCIWHTKWGWTSQFSSPSAVVDVIIWEGERSCSFVAGATSLLIAKW
jgi:hypothetical protein